MMNWIISSTILISVIIGLRFLLKGKISLRLQYGLWTIVLIRLLIPVSIGETVISVGNWLEQLSQKEEVHKVYEFTQAKLPEMSYQQAYQEVLERYESQGLDIEAIPEEEFAETIEYEIQEKMTGDVSLAEIAKFVWGIGVIAVGLGFLFTNIRFLQKVLKSRKVLNLDTETLASDTRELLEASRKKLNIYLCDEVDTPCLFGLFHPAVYVTSEVLRDEEVLRHVITHETTHFLHRDYIWGYLRALCLSIHWYNPFVWCAAILSRNDAELACDEVTIARLGEAERAAYGRTLIGLTCEKPVAVLLTATTMTGSGKSIKERISLIVKKPKMKMYTFVVVVLIAIISVGCTFTGAKNDKDSDTEQNLSTENVDENEDFEQMQNVQNDGGLTGIESLTNNKILFYDALSQDMLITDEEVNGRVLQLLLNEKQLIDTIEWQCEMDFDQSIDVDGRPYYRVLEADSWAYYEDIARNYYEEEYFEEEFTKTYIEEHKLFVEADGKLYRAAADGVVPVYIEDSIQLWKVDEYTYYATIRAEYGSGYFDTMGYQLCLSENNIYGFKIVDKPYVESNAKSFTYFADLTHDGIDEMLEVCILDENGKENAKASIRVYDASSVLLYETEVLLHPNLCEDYYLASYEGNSYLMRYKTDVNHETIVWQYEVFYLSEAGEKILYDEFDVQVSLYHVDEIDVEEWKRFAEETNKYFQKTYLLAGTRSYGELEYSTNIERLNYMEQFTWLLMEDTENVKNGLEYYLEGLREIYGIE